MIGGRRITVDRHAQPTTFVPGGRGPSSRGTPLEAAFKGQAGNLTGNIALNAAGQAAPAAGHGQRGHRRTMALNVNAVVATPPTARFVAGPHLHAAEPEDRRRRWRALPGSLCRHGDAGPAAPRPRRRTARRRRPEARASGAPPIGGSVEEILGALEWQVQCFSAKANELGVMLFMHPQPAEGTTLNPSSERGGLGNTIASKDRVPVAPDFRRDADQVTQLKFQRPRRRLPGVLQRPVGCALRARSGR